MAQLDSNTIPEIIQAKIEKITVYDTQTVTRNDTITVIDSIVIVDTVIAEVKEFIPEEVKKEIESSKPELGKIFSGGKIFWSIVVCIIAYFIIKLLVVIIERFAERSTNHRITLKSISPIIRIVGWILVIIIIIQGIFQPPMASIIAALASVGIAIGFAAQDILKNIFGGIMIIFDRPFQVGDKIEVGEYYGEVKEIGLRSTRIVTKDDSLVSLPNAELVNKAVSNSNAGEANCQVVAEIYLPIDIDTDAVRQIAKEAAQVSRYIYLNKPIVVLFFNDVKDKRSFLKMRLKAYVSDIRNEFAFKSDMTELVMGELLKKEIIDKKDLM
jgi:small-conductance mechanosensitive channel